jgi:hypothetical protein
VSFVTKNPVFLLIFWLCRAQLQEQINIRNLIAATKGSIGKYEEAQTDTLGS